MTVTTEPAYRILTRDDLADIRAAYATGARTRDLAAKFGVHQRTICRHVSRVAVTRPPDPVIAPDPGPGSRWPNRAACRNADDPDAFTPDENDAAAHRYARAFCKQCPVTAECLAYGMSLPEAHAQSIYAGATAKQRRNQRRRARK